jgi:hypothetical protein
MVVLFARAGADLAFAVLSFVVIVDVDFFAMVPPANAGSPIYDEG